MTYVSDIEFAQKAWFIMLLVLPLMLLFYIVWHRERFMELKLPSLKGVQHLATHVRPVLRHGLLLLRGGAIVFLVLALARPQSTSSTESVTTEGIDIVLAMDVSTSMLAEDFKPNRIEAAKNVAAEFIEGRPNDRIGLVVFAGESLAECPITTDHKVLKQQLVNITSGKLNDGTAIGLGLGNAVNGLLESKAVSKVVILLTDGVNNSGFIDPMTAAETAKQFNVRVYTIGVGSQGYAPYPFQTPFGRKYQQIEVKIDEKLLQEIADFTGGQYFRATSNSKLKDIYAEIDEMEKTKIERSMMHDKEEHFYAYAWWAFFLLGAELFARYTIFRSMT